MTVYNSAPNLFFLFLQTVLFSITKSEFDLVNTAVEIKVIDSAKKSQLSLVGLYKVWYEISWRLHRMLYFEKSKEMFKTVCSIRLNTATRDWIYLGDPNFPL